jgi:hypothetical protein
MLTESSQTSAGRDRQRPVRPVTVRAVLIGALAVACLAAANPYGSYVRGTWSVGWGSLVSSAIVLLFLLVSANGIIARVRPKLAFTQAELLVVYGMVIVCIEFVGGGGMPFLLGSTTYPAYFATPSNDWQHIIWPHIPYWLRLGNLEAADWFWEGLPDGVGVPWGIWLTPLLAWASFTIALLAATFCLGALLSRDWIERQRLAFPLADIPLAITGADSPPTLRGSIFSNRILWAGFAIPSALAIVDFLHRLYPSVPATRIDVDLGPYFAGMGLPWRVFSGHWSVRVNILYSVIGITSLVPGEVSLSLWLFHVLFRIQQLVWAGFGVAEEGGTAAINISPRAFIAFEEAGGFIALSGMVLYRSRGALKAAWQSLTRGSPSESDPYEPLAGKWALLGFVLANGFMLWWALRAGMSWWAFAALLGLFYTVLLGASRLVAAAGVTYVDTGVFPRQVIMGTVGALPIGYRALTLYSYLSVIYMYDPNSLLMPQMMNSFKLVHAGRIRGKLFSLAAALAVVVMLGVGLPALLSVVHTRGALAVPPWNPFTSYPGWAFGELESSMRGPETPNNWYRLALVLGAGLAWGLVALHARFVWWPVSPVGFLIASSFETIRSLWANVFIAWLISTLIRRYGGLRLYRALRPAFLGLVLGEYLTQGALSIVATIFGIR